MALYLTSSPARQKFKKMLGNGNHLLITAMIGLDAIDRGLISRAPKNYPAKWTPRDPQVSATRSRNLILEMGLIRSVDALDTYISWTNRKPFLVQSSSIRNQLDGAGRSIRDKFQVIEERYPPKDNILSAIVAVLIQWRNKAVHNEDRGVLETKYANVLDGKAEEIFQRFHGLNTKCLLVGYNSNRPARLKEVTSFINATHQYVRAVDGDLLARLETETYLQEIIWKGICEPEGLKRSDERRIMQLLENKWGTGLKRRRQAVEGFLRRLGLSSEAPHPGEPRALFDDSLLEELTSRTPREVYEWVAPPETMNRDSLSDGAC